MFSLMVFFTCRFAGIRSEGGEVVPVYRFVCRDRFSPEEVDLYVLAVDPADAYYLTV